MIGDNKGMATSDYFSHAWTNANRTIIDYLLG